MGLIGEFVAALAVILAVVIVIVLLVVAAASRAARVAAGQVCERVDSRERRRLQWSSPVDDVAKALIAEQPVSFWVDHRRALRRRRVDYLFVPLTSVRVMGPHAADSLATAWHVWQSSSGRGCTVRIPASGWELARRLTAETADMVAVYETLDSLMCRVHDLRWGDHT